MVKKIKIGEKECTFASSAAIPRLYRIKFHKDLFCDMSKITKEASENGEVSIESLEAFENIAYLMHKHGDPSQPEDINEWLDQFEIFSIYSVLPQIIEMWQLENKTMSTPKKK